MPHKQRPPSEVAVTASPLFKLALEVRIMIYELLLIQEGGIYIPRDIFARRDSGRTGSTAYECLYCGLILLSYHGSKQHMVEHYPQVPPNSFHPLRVLLPGLSVSLLQTCHIIRLEASPILYSRNSFHFTDPATMSNFRWGTDCAQAKATPEIGIILVRCTPLEPWVAYFTKRTLSLGQDFPHLRRMTIDLQFWWGCEIADLLRSMSEGLRQRRQRLEWVLVLAFCAEEVLDCFKPLVDGANASDDGKKEVRQHVWPVMSGSVWKNSLLWWGSPGEVVPQKYRRFYNSTQLTNNYLLSL